jgi:large subunit ribosomal protein L29
MKAKELREMSDEQLAETLKETVRTLFRLRIRSQTERLDAPSNLLKQRRLIARIKTIQTERLTAKNEPAKAASAQAATAGKAAE